MLITINEGFTKKERLITIKNAWHTLGNELYTLAQKSKKIDYETKTKLTKEICNEFARQEVVPFLEIFNYGNISINFDENNAIILGNVIKKYTEKEYEELVEQSKNFEYLFDKKIEESNKFIESTF